MARTLEILTNLLVYVKYSSQTLLEEERLTLTSKSGVPKLFSMRPPISVNKNRANLDIGDDFFGVDFVSSGRHVPYFFPSKTT